MHTPAPKKELSERLSRTLDRMEEVLREISAVGDELMIQYLIETGELNPDDITDFMTRKENDGPA